MASRIIKIATRSSPLAMWQANKVKELIEQNNYKCEIVAVETSGDSHLNQPVYSFGVTGIFTKQLDISLLNNETDIAVHSLKDVPVDIAKGLILAATLERGAHEDIIILKNKNTLNDNSVYAKIASGSLRRKAQWLAKYSNHEIVPIRGNVQTRLRKFSEDETLDGIIFAKAGLERLNISLENVITLDWMLPASAQGIVGVACRDGDEEVVQLCKKINNINSYTEALVERDFLKSLMGGCSVPIGAHVKVHEGKIFFKGGIYDYDGSKNFYFEREFKFSDAENIGSFAAKKILENPGAQELMEKIRKAKC